MKISSLSIALFFALLAYFSQAAFLPFHKESQGSNKFLDECVQWGQQNFTKDSFGKAENIVPVYNLTSVVANYTFISWEGPPCPASWNVTLSVYCPYVGENQILDYHVKQIH